MSGFYAKISFQNIRNTAVTVDAIGTVVNCATGLTRLDQRYGVTITNCTAGNVYVYSTNSDTATGFSTTQFLAKLATGGTPFVDGGEPSVRYFVFADAAGTVLFREMY